MSSVALVAIVATFLVFAAVSIALAMAGRAEGARRERLKAHLNWVDPEPQVARRRRSSLR